MPGFEGRIHSVTVAIITPTMPSMEELRCEKTTKRTSDMEQAEDSTTGASILCFLSIVTSLLPLEL